MLIACGKGGVCPKKIIIDCLKEMGVLRAYAKNYALENGTIAVCREDGSKYILASGKWKKEREKAG